MDVSTDGEKSRSHTKRKLLTTAAILLLAVGFVGGVYANFTDTAQGGPTPITTGQVHIVLATPAGDYGSLTVGPVNNMAEGDSVARVVQLTNNTNLSPAGQTGLSTLNLQTSVSGTNAASDIVNDTTNGLQVQVQLCATAPTESGGVSGPWTYTCSGGFTTVVATEPLKTLDTTPSTLTAPNEGATNYYVVTVSLPTTYADAYSYSGGACSTGGTLGFTEQLQNCTLSITWNFTAVQRAGANQ